MKTTYRGYKASEKKQCKNCKRFISSDSIETGSIAIRYQCSNCGPVLEYKLD